MPKKAGQTRRRDVPDADHIARYCNPQRVIRDVKTKAIKGVFPQAFELRVAESYISTYWMESFEPRDISIQFREVTAALREKHKGVKPTGAFARLNAGSVVQAGTQRNLRIRIRDHSSPHDPGYCGIFGMPQDNSDPQLLSLLASQCCIEVRGVSEIDAVSAPVPAADGSTNTAP